MIPHKNSADSWETWHTNCAFQFETCTSLVHASTIFENDFYRLKNIAEKGQLEVGVSTHRLGARSDENSQ